MASLAFAQDTGRFTGTITDASGAIVSGATIKVKNAKTGTERTGTSNDSGLFFVTNLAASTYTLTAASPGLNDVVFTEINLALGQERTLAITMQPTTVATSVTVDSGELAVVDTSSASQRFTTDCEICCRPMEVTVECEPGELLSLDVVGS